MKEIIAKRNKISSVFMLALCIFTLLVSVLYLQKVPMLQFAAVGMMILCGLMSAASLVFLFSPNAAIEKTGDILVIRKGITKTTVNVSQIIEAFPTPHPNKKDQTLKNNITIKISDNGKEKLISCPDIANVDEALQKLTALINK